MPSGSIGLRCRTRGSRFPMTHIHVAVMGRYDYDYNMCQGGHGPQCTLWTAVYTSRSGCHYSPHACHAVRTARACVRTSVFHSCMAHTCMYIARRCVRTQVFRPKRKGWRYAWDGWNGQIALAGWLGFTSLASRNPQDRGAGTTVLTVVSCTTKVFCQ